MAYVAHTTLKTTMIIATYNIHRCIGRDGNFDPNRIITIVNNLEAHFIALQEVESYREGGDDLLKFFEQKTGLQAIAGPTMFSDTSSYGNAVLTSAAVKDTKHIDISMNDYEPRGAISIHLEFNGLDMHMLATHLGLAPRERRWQVKQLLAEMEAGPSPIQILMGDVNEWFLWGRPLRWLHRHFSMTASPATFPARYPVLALDRIWVQPTLCLQNVQAVSTSLTRLASDHLPLRAELALDVI
jgi:endonuclease/exonuclease/phosphatase family metal-dependent hydrolase